MTSQRFISSYPEKPQLGDWEGMKHGRQPDHSHHVVLGDGSGLASAAQCSFPQVRLLTGIGRYNEMTYIFDLLHQKHYFEVLMRKKLDPVRV